MCRRLEVISKAVYKSHLLLQTEYPQKYVNFQRFSTPYPEVA